MPSVSVSTRQCRSLHSKAPCSGQGCLIHFPQDRDAIRRSISADRIADGLVPAGLAGLAIEQWASSPSKPGGARGVGGRGYQSTGVEGYKKATRSEAEVDRAAVSRHFSRASLSSLYSASPNHINAPSTYQSNAYSHSRSSSAGNAGTATAVSAPPPSFAPSPPTLRAHHASRNSLSLSSTATTYHASYVPSPLSQSITSRTLLLNPLTERVALASSTPAPSRPPLAASAGAPSHGGRPTRPLLSRSCRPYEPGPRPLYVPQQYAAPETTTTLMEKASSLPLPYTAAPVDSLACAEAQFWVDGTELPESVAERKAEVAKHLKGSKVAGGEVEEVEGWWGTKE